MPETTLGLGPCADYKHVHPPVRNVIVEHEEQLALGQRVADRVALVVGSWPFIIVQSGLFLVWVAINVYLVFNAITQPGFLKAWDPYPFILLNLVLSCLAALQAPIIIMSQNRMEARDRLRAEQDYKVNLKAELEIRHLDEKLDHLLKQQWTRLLEIQEIQLELMEELAARKR